MNERDGKKRYKLAGIESAKISLKNEN